MKNENKIDDMLDVLAKFLERKLSSIMEASGKKISKEETKVLLVKVGEFVSREVNKLDK